MHKILSADQKEGHPWRKEGGEECSGQRTACEKALWSEGTWTRGKLTEAAGVGGSRSEE